MESLGKALIAGASSGIGAIYADRLAKRGYDLIVVARHQERLKAVLERISGDTNRSVEVMAADLTNAADLRRVEQALRTDATIELLVNNAGSAMTGHLAVSDVDDLETMIRLNVVAPTRLATAVLPGFIAGRRHAHRRQLGGRTRARVGQRGLQRHEGVSAQSECAPAARTRRHRDPGASGTAWSNPDRHVGEGRHGRRHAASRHSDGRG